MPLSDGYFDSVEVLNICWCSGPAPAPTRLQLYGFIGEANIPLRFCRLAHFQLIHLYRFICKAIKF